MWQKKQYKTKKAGGKKQSQKKQQQMSNAEKKKLNWERKQKEKEELAKVRWYFWAYFNHLARLR